MSGDPQQVVAAAIRDRVAARAAPGIIGTTTPQALLVTGAPWSAAQIELWRDTELAWANTALVDGVSAPDPDRIARVGLALADTRVRDVVLALTVREARAAQVAEGLWPVVTSLPHPWRTPAGTVLAWTEWVQGRDPVAVLDLAAIGHGYRLADMLRTAAAGGVVGDVTRAFTDGALEDYRYGTEDVDIAWKAAADQHVVLGQALNRAGWSLHVSVVEPDAGRLVGYLLHDHTRVAVVQARVDFDPTDAPGRRGRGPGLRPAQHRRGGLAGRGRQRRGHRRGRRRGAGAGPKPGPGLPAGRGPAGDQPDRDRGHRPPTDRRPDPRAPADLREDHLMSAQPEQAPAKPGGSTPGPWSPAPTCAPWPNRTPSWSTRSGCMASCNPRSCTPTGRTWS